MTPEIRRAALLVAAKATMIASLGCSGGRTPAPAAEPAPAAPPVSCAEHLGALATAKPDQLPASDPLHGRANVYGAFTDVDARGSARTLECCDEELTRDGSGAAHRWECCSALPESKADALMIACTPWGPPCPPELLA